jgi:hypothetical protein
MYSMLNPPRINSYATGETTKWKDHLEDTLIDDTEQVELQLWKYDPQILAKDSTVDVLSLAMCFGDDPDERVEEAVEEMLEEYKWLEDLKVFSHGFRVMKNNMQLSEVLRVIF